MARLRFTSLIGFALAMALAASPAGAQDKKGAGGGGGRQGGGRQGGGFAGAMGGFGQVTRLSLISREQVANEVKVTPEEKTKIADLMKDFPVIGSTGNTKDLSADEKKKLFAENQEKRKKATAEAEKKLDTILKPEQSKRLEEIYIQQRGVLALSDEKVAKALKLSEEQVGKIDGAVKWGTEEQIKLRPSGGERPSREDLAALREKQQKLQKEVDDKVLASLNDTQKADFEKMKGSPFTLERTGGRQGGPGGPGGGGNRKGSKDA